MTLEEYCTERLKLLERENELLKSQLEDSEKRNEIKDELLKLLGDKITKKDGYYTFDLVWASSDKKLCQLIEENVDYCEEGEE